jgi:hypothetical protein
VLLGDFRQGQPRAAIFNDLLPIHIEPRSPDLPTFQLRPAHATFDALHNQ